jgi:hypothetical protein
MRGIFKSDKKKDMVHNYLAVLHIFGCQPQI